MAVFRFEEVFIVEVFRGKARFGGKFLRSSWSDEVVFTVGFLYWGGVFFVRLEVVVRGSGYIRSWFWVERGCWFYGRRVWGLGEKVVFI